MLEKLKAFLRKIGFDLTGKTDAEIKALAESEGLTEPTKEPGDGDKEPKHNSEIIKQLQTQNAQLAAFVEEMKSDKTKRDAETQAQAANALKAKVTAEITQAKKDGRLPAGADGEALQTQQRWAKMLESDFDTAKSALDAMPKAPGKSENSETSQQPKTSDQPNTLVGSGVSPKIMAFANANIPSSPVSNN